MTAPAYQWLRGDKDGNQYYRVSTERASFDFYVTPKGYLRVEQPRVQRRPFPTSATKPVTIKR